MGAAFGLMFTGLETSPIHQDITNLPFRQQLSHVYRDMKARSLSLGKNFAKVGALYGTSECLIEGVRAKHDIVNAVLAGCVSGGVLAMSSGGPGAVGMGCLGFAGFSAAIEYFTEGMGM